MHFKQIVIDNVRYEVSLDYYKVDGIRMPLNLREAWEVADHFNCVLPTPEIVNAIWQQANIRLEPKTLPPTSEMTSMSYFQRHDRLIEEQLEEYGNVEGLLIAGHKKDIVYQPRNSNRVAIYGWHRPNGAPIQSRSTVHSWDYKDYSHGLRLVREV